MPKYSVLCYIINDYEIVREIGEKDPEAEYILVTDDKNLKSETWTVVYDEDLLKMRSTFDKCYSIRFNVFKYCHAPICIYIDANVQVNKPLTPLIKKFEEGKYDMCLMPHPLRNLFLTEYKAWLRNRRYPFEQAKKFFKLLSDSRYPANYRGIFQGTFKIVRNDKTNSDFERMSLAFLNYLGTEEAIERLDQTVYSFVLNTWFQDKKILPVSEQILRSEYMTWYWHKKNRKNENIFYQVGKPDLKVMFNKIVECYMLLDGELRLCDDVKTETAEAGTKPSPAVQL